ncbi:hypothetical protein ABFX02_08G195400 [Erythranthe guttata]
MPSSNNFLSLHLFFFFLLTASILKPSSSQQQTNISSFSSSASPWRPNQNQILLSPNSVFAAGFRPLENSPSLYTFSVWYHNISSNDVVWSANPLSPVSSAASLLISTSGDLRLVNSSVNGPDLWPAPAAGIANRTRLSLLNTGNLVYGASFRSFFFPTNTILPGQQINETILVSKNGKFMFDSRQLIFTGRNDTYWTNSGNQTFMILDNLGVVSYGDNSMYYAADFGVEKLRRLTLDEDGNLRLYSYDELSSEWIVGWQAQFQLCMIHGTCGPNSICLYDASNLSTSCVCPPGYRKGAESDGYSCELKIPIAEKSKFLKLDFVNFTGGSNQTDIKVHSFSTCESRCLSKRNCLGFMFKYDGSNYCVLQLDTMVDGYWSPGTETAMFLRVDASETDVSNFTGMTNLMQTMCPVKIRLPQPTEESRTTSRNIAIICALFAAELFSGMFFFWAFLNKYIKYRDMASTFGLEVMPSGGPKRFSYNELKVATNDFSNVIGRGGFGVVYMGKLSDGRVVAVKCLKNVGGGDGDFWAEVTIIARMHHLNLVRLWGFCAEKGSRILVYEYVSNGSLDEFLFQTVGADQSETGEPIMGSNNKPIFDWNIRYRIALGVARAIAYLHEECLEWVLHCDIKPENILLGDDFCPKVSDFGLAKLKKKEDMISVSKIRGTPGYMAPEWAQPEPITSKADVYSYGLVLLEIVSGSRNSTQLDPKVESDQWFFPRWAFDKVFTEMNVEDVLDRRIKHIYDSKEHFDMINRMVKTAMWCLQHKAENRPSMGKVAKMLEGTVEITEPKKPTIFFLDD